MTKLTSSYNFLNRKNLILESAAELLASENQLNEIYLHYQPKYSTASGHLVGFEALSRWNHRILGEISPCEFIPLIEQTNLIHKFTKYIIEKSISDIGENLTEGILQPVAVNVSIQDLDQPGFVELIIGLLKKYKVPAELLEIEITERSISQNIGLSIQRVMELQKIGLKVAIDDFGTGTSSIAYLADLPIDYIKLDTDLINRIGDIRTGLIIKSIINMASSIGIGLVAEGVESVNTFEKLKSFNCPTVQGFLFGRPSPRNIAFSNK